MTISSIFQTNDAGVSQTTTPSTSSDIQIDTTDVVVDLPVTRLAIAVSYSGFRILVTVVVDATADISETFDLLGTSNGAAWTMSQNSVQSSGGSSNVDFKITPAGQITYTSTSTPGFVKRTIQWTKQIL